MFENKMIKEYAHASRFIIMSWIRSGGTFSVRGEGYKDFENWLKSLELSEDDIIHIMDIARTGKLELEISAKKFIKDNTKIKEA